MIRSGGKMGDTENKTMEAWMKKHTRMIMKVMNLMIKMKIQISNFTTSSPNVMALQRKYLNIQN